MRIENWSGHSIRFVEHNGEWWAVAQDVAKALSFSRTAHMVRMVDVMDKGVHKVDTLGGTQELLIIREFGIYQCIFQSHKPEAKNFQKWAFGVFKSLREASGLAGFEVFRMLDKQHQREMMQRLSQGIRAVRAPVRVDFIKANTIANKAISSLHGYPKMVKKSNMTPDMLAERESVLADTVSLMTLKERYNMDISVSENIYRGNRIAI